VAGGPLLLVLVAASASAPGLDVRGTTSCPTPAAVSERLRPLLPGAADLAAGAWLQLDEVPRPEGDAAGREIEIRLQRAPADAPLAARRVSASAACDDTAEEIAVIVATWVARYAAAPPAALALAEPPPPAPPPAPPAPAVVVRAAATPPAEAQGVWLGVGAGVVAAAAGTAAPFVAAEARVRLRGARLGLGLLVGTVEQRSLALGSGSAAWTRNLASPGADWTLGTPAAFAQLGLGALVGVAQLEGRGFSQNRTSTSLDVGALPWVRVGARLAAAPITLWLGAGAMVWLRTQHVEVGGVGSDGTLPAVDALVGGGVAWTTNL
jgi:hypothetical protein